MALSLFEPPWSQCEAMGIPVLSPSCLKELDKIYPSVAIITSSALLLGLAHVFLVVGGLKQLIGPKHHATLVKTVDAVSETDVIAKKRAGTGRVKLHTTCQDVVTSVVSTALFIIYFSVVTDRNLNRDPANRLYGSSDWAVFGLRLHLACTVYELTLYAFLGKDMMSYLHHIFVIINFTRALRSGMMMFYGCWLGLVEGTNPFLSLTFATLRMGLKDSAWLPIYTLLLMISFLTLRIASLPAAYIALVLDVADHGLRSDDPSIAVVTAKSSRYYTGNSSHYFYSDAFGSDLLYYNLGRATIAFLWIVSVYWFWKMLRGHFKMKRRRKSGHVEKAE